MRSPRFVYFGRHADGGVNRKLIRRIDSLFSRNRDKAWRIMLPIEWF